MIKQLLYILIISLFFYSCKKNSLELNPQPYKQVTITPIYVNDSISVRALELYKSGFIFADNTGAIGKYENDSLQLKELKQDSIVPHFRSIAYNGTAVFALSIANPALLFKNDSIVYQERGEKVFYDCLKFWNEKEGIALGDEINGCMSVIITRDGGDTWQKLPCESLPEIKEETGAFAASNTNIVAVGDKTWMITGGKESTVLYSHNKGKTWSKIKTPIVQGKATQGMYSVDFYDDKNGFVIGGAYDLPNDTLANKIRTQDGGKTWQGVANGKAPGYRSCVQYIPHSNAQELVAVGFKGIAYTSNAGETWKQLSDESFYTIRFVNDSVAYAAGKGRIAKLVFE